MIVLLGVLVAASFGAGDFLGGYASRRSPTVSVLALAQVCAVGGAVGCALLFGGSPDRRDLVFGAVAGALNVGGLGCLYQGLARGRMGIVAPVTAVVASVQPVAWGLLTDERPAPVALVGVVCAVTAGVLIAHERDAAGAACSSGLVYALLAGIGFGASFILFAETDDGSGFWPLLTARAAALAIVVAVAVLVRRTIRVVAGNDRWLALGAGALDVAATALLLVAVRREQTSLVAPIAALAPAFTVGLSWWLLREPIARLQGVGLLVALVGLALIAAG